MNAFDGKKMYYICQVIYPNGRTQDVYKIVSGIQRDGTVYKGIEVTTNEVVKWNARCAVDYYEYTQNQKLIKIKLNKV
jgi:hypothetical protein